MLIVNRLETQIAETVCFWEKARKPQGLNRITRASHMVTYAGRRRTLVLIVITLFRNGKPNNASAERHTNASAG